MTQGYLLIAHADEPQLTLLDAGARRVIRQFETPGRIAVLGASSDGRYGFAVHRDDDCVTIIDAKKGVVTAICAVGKQPTHFHAHGGHSLIFNDGDGSVVVFDEADIPEFRTYPVTQPDHGSALLLNDALLVGYLCLGCVEVYRQDTAEHLQTFDDCTTLHGAAQVGETALFGCSDGVLLVRPDGGQFTAVKLDNPADTPEQVRVGLFATHPSRPLALGNFGQGLALIDLEAQSMRSISLPSHPLTFGFDPAGDNLLVLTRDGQLRQMTLRGHTRRKVTAVAPASIPKGPDKKVRPTFALGNSSIYLTDPDGQLLVRFSEMDLSGTFRHALDFTPANFIYLEG